MQVASMAMSRWVFYALNNSTQNGNNALGLLALLNETTGGFQQCIRILYTR